jgi:hypothetical protein
MKSDGRCCMSNAYFYDLRHQVLIDGLGLSHFDASNVMRRLDRIFEAADTLYMAGKWSREDGVPEEDAQLWSNLRDALGFSPGTATKAGVSG